ncbi:MAG: hypothetical protein R2828_16665 [Saprospiraceae bacterium]
MTKAVGISSIGLKSLLLAALCFFSPDHSFSSSLFDQLPRLACNEYVEEVTKKDLAFTTNFWVIKVSTISSFFSFRPFKLATHHTTKASIQQYTLCSSPNGFLIKWMQKRTLSYL